MNPRDRRTFIVGGRVILAGVLVLRLIPAGVRAWEGERRELTERSALLARAEALVAGVDGLERAGAETRAKLVGLAPMLLSGGSEAEALADLNGRLTLAGNRSRTRLLRSDQVLDSTRVAQLRCVRVRVQVESDWSGLVGFFHSAVADPATLQITALAVRSNDGAPIHGPEILQGEVEVSGWYLKAPVAKEGK